MNSNSAHTKFEKRVIEQLQLSKKVTRPTLEKWGRELGIVDKRLVKELTELAVLNYGRTIIKGKSINKAYSLLVDLYNIQPNSSYRSSDSAKYQQYSTPLPISFLLGRFIDGFNPNKRFFEPSAGNGLLTIGLHPSQTHVNELEPMRLDLLRNQGFWAVTGYDATMPLDGVWNNYQGVISNPPFGKFDDPFLYKGVKLLYLDHLMVLRALEGLTDNGKAGFVIGGHLKFDKRGRITIPNGRFFFNHLYANYNVVDIIQIDGSALYQRQGTAYNTTLILIDGKKQKPFGSAPLENAFNTEVMDNHTDLFHRIKNHIGMIPTKEELKQKAKALLQKYKGLSGLDAPYTPTSDACFVLNTEAPDTMAFEMHSAMAMIKEAVGGDIDNFVRHRLGYFSKDQLCKALSAEQIDAVAMAIYNIEAKSQGCIIGDQTGIGKGRVGASVIRYANVQGLKPIFITEKANLFSDLYRDLIAIGSQNLAPFIVNSKDSKTNIKDAQGNILYSALRKDEQMHTINSLELENYDLIMATYSQFNSANITDKKLFLEAISKDQILIMDESHNASGSSNTGLFLKNIVKSTKSTIFLSATFAKRPENMPIYALKTAMSDANMSSELLSSAILEGGVPLQEIVASQLVAEGQMIRRERSYEGVKVEYKTLETKKIEHRAIADNVTSIMRDIIAFQANFITPFIDEMDESYAKEGKEIRKRGGTSRAGVDNMPYFSKVFNLINQMLFAIKAEDVAHEAIKQLKEGKKPIIAFASTMGSFLKQTVEEQGIIVGDGQSVRTDFALILKNGLDGVLRYTVTDHDGEKEYDSYDPSELGFEAEQEYNRILTVIEAVSTGVYISPIDIILSLIHDAGFTTHEVTGRSLKVNYNSNKRTGTIERKKKIAVNDAYADFNNNEVDVLLINQSGSTGASAQAMITTKVPKSEVKPRVMIVLQMELNVDTEIQKRGRIYRTGQIYMPEYLYINSAIPAEQRMMMMLRQKLKSLDANTSSNQDQNKKMLNVPDFLNKYGDNVVSEYLSENRELYQALGSPDTTTSNGEVAHRASGRIAVMPTDVQEQFYNEIVSRYLEYVEYLKQTGEYDLEIESLDLKATPVSKKILILGNGGFSRFGMDTYLEKLEVNALRKPFSKTELSNIITESLNGLTPETYQTKLIEDFKAFQLLKLEAEKLKIETKYNQTLERLSVKKSLLSIKEKEGVEAYNEQLDIAKKEVEKDEENALFSLERNHTSQRQHFMAMVTYFKVGRTLRYPYQSLSNGQLTVFLGFDIKADKKNPYAPSAIKLRFALASSMKYLVLPSSYALEINAIKGASIQQDEVSLDNVFDVWEEALQGKVKDREFRYMVTGNILQGFSSMSGKLISYTTHNGEIKKGIFLPEQYSIQQETQKGVTVPLTRAISYIQSQGYGRIISLSNEVAIINKGGTDEHLYQIRVPSSKMRGGQFFLNEQLIKLTKDKKFEKIGTAMVALIESSKLLKFLQQLEERFKVNIVLKEHEFKALNLDALNNSNKVQRIIPPPKEQEIDGQLLKLKAKALILKFKLKQRQKLVA